MSDAVDISERCHKNTRLLTTTLFSYPEPVSPHLYHEEASSLTDQDIVHTIHNALDDASMSACLVETAGGALSPIMTRSLQADVYKTSTALKRTVLVGDSKLGGISTTLSSFEAMVARGLEVKAVYMCISPEEDEYLGMTEFVSAQVAPVPVYRLPAIPPEDQPLDQWFEDSHVVLWESLRNIGFN